MVMSAEVRCDGLKKKKKVTSLGLEKLSEKTGNTVQT